MGDARLTAETLGHRGLASVSGYTKITDARRREAYEEMQRRGCSIRGLVVTSHPRTPQDLTQAVS